MNKTVFFLISLLLSATMAEAKSSKTVKIKVVETSDVHGHFFPYDFMEKRPIRGTLSRANTYIKKQREKYGEDHFLLIDNGDILQGQPCVYWSNYVMPEDENRQNAYDKHGHEPSAVAQVGHYHIKGGICKAAVD